MNVLHRAQKLYDKIGMDMFADISTYLAYGYVYKTPESLILAKTVNKDSSTPPQEQWKVLDCNAWFVHMAIGDKCIGRWVNLMPFELPFVGWARESKKRPIKFYEVNKILRRI